MQLSDEQSKAVFTESKRALCLAGAGSGKTRVLVARVQNLVENCHVSPSEILTVTFTRKASGEMRERLEKAIGNSAYGITMGTIHSMALKMLQRFGEYVGLNPGKITVYSDWEEKTLLKDVCKELDYHNGKTWKGVKKKEVDEAFYLLYTENGRDPKAFAANDILDAFFARCRENNALTYGSILTTFLELLPKISHMLNFRHILIDEVQDNDKLQWKIVNNLCRLCNAKLFAVGDIRQAIFGFRGSDPGYLLENRSQFDVYELNDNYRSDGHIVDAANRMIVNNQLRLGEEMSPKKAHVNEVSTMINMDTEGLLNGIKSIPEDNDGSIAVLARNHFMLKKLSRVLFENDIDHEYVGRKTAFTRSEEFRRVHAFLKLIVNPFDNFSFMLIKDHIEINGYRDIRLKAAQEDKSHFQVWSESDLVDNHFAYAYIHQNKDSDFKDIVHLLIGVDFGFDSNPVIDFIEDYIEKKPDPKIEKYLNWLAIYDVQDELTSDPKKIQLMTIHASKGLEWPTVVIAGMNDGVLPSKHAENDIDEMESERRLAYVAYTRAEDQLVLTSRPCLDSDGKLKSPVSRFVRESLTVPVEV